MSILVAVLPLRDYSHSLSAKHVDKPVQLTTNLTIAKVHWLTLVSAGNE